ncbi:uncharacterized protein LOC143565485 [Bidens hawaiensis]|uniref:uncharacterized protein LOC143565485 n=1 Tax=Bidens hawaiensis TaxID=980011 RepID=UPI00404B3788
MDYPNGPPFHPFSPEFISDGSFLPDSDTYPPPIDVDRSLPELLSALNLSPATRRSYSGEQVGSSFSAGEGFHHPVVHSQNRRWCDGGSGFRRGFDFDQMSRFDFDYFPSFSANPVQEMSDSIRRLDYYDQQNRNADVISVWNLEELRGRIYVMAKDQNGCRILQTMLERSTMEGMEIMLSELLHFVSDLMKDQFGNYLVQKLVAMCNDDQKLRLILSLTRVPSDIILVCMNPHGTRAMQKLLESLNTSQVMLVMKALYRGAATLAVDPNGHHVIQYCLINFHSDVNKPILTEIANECYKIATDRSGCCVLQACVEHSRGEAKARIIAEIMANAVHLAEDPFGNYVLQHMVGLNIAELTALLVRQLKGNFAYSACNKYASNVVEKCLNESGEEMSTRIVMELVGSPNSSMLLVDPYANFVIQSALTVSKQGFAYDCLCSLISKNTMSMRTNLYGKKILEKVEKKGQLCIKNVVTKYVCGVLLLESWSPYHVLTFDFDL